MRNTFEKTTQLIWPYIQTLCILAERMDANRDAIATQQGSLREEALVTLGENQERDRLMRCSIPVALEIFRGLTDDYLAKNLIDDLQAEYRLDMDAGQLRELFHDLRTDYAEQVAHYERIAAQEEALERQLAAEHGFDRERIDYLSPTPMRL